MLVRTIGLAVLMLLSACATATFPPPPARAAGTDCWSGGAANCPGASDPAGQAP
jgi:hypothetical protein